MEKGSPCFDLSGRCALVTGAGRGLGFAMAQGLAAAGAEVWLGGRRPDVLDEAVERLRTEGLATHPAPFDVSDADACAAWFADNPAPDILINNATLRDRKETPALQDQDVQRLLEVNTLAAFRLTRLAVPAMLDRGKGAIVNVTSIAGPLAGAADSGYTLAKGGLAAMTRSHAVEFGGRGIRVNAIAPGFFATESNEAWVEDRGVQGYLDIRSPMKRWGHPREIAGAAVFLCSDAASYINGQTLVVDGGMSVKM